MFKNVVGNSQFILIFSLAALIAAGTVLLKSPLVEFDGELSWLDSLFTCTSAACVVGLSSVPTDSFNLAGQWVIILLMQGGGIGMMTIAASFVLMLRHDFTWRRKHMLASINDDFPICHVGGLIKTVIGYSLIIESIGFLLMLPGFLFIEKYDLFHAVHYSLFHTVSAFCNAGFSPFPDNLMGIGSYLKLVICALIVSGGLGFYAIYDIVRHRRREHFQVNTKIILFTTFLLITGGTLAVKGFEWLGGEQIAWVDALFQSITSRTAGFNTVHIPALESSTLFILTVLMFIGASPNSTGGGIKTTTFAVALLSAWSILCGREKLTVFKRNIEAHYQIKAFAIIMTFMALILSCSIFICMTVESHFSIKEIGFEVVSALTTTGLSLGYSMEAEPYGKTALIVCMFLGRIGPFATFMFLVGRTKAENLSYPEESITLI